MWSPARRELPQHSREAPRLHCLATSSRHPRNSHSLPASPRAHLDALIIREESERRPRRSD